MCAAQNKVAFIPSCRETLACTTVFKIIKMKNCKRMTKWTFWKTSRFASKVSFLFKIILRRGGCLDLWLISKISAAALLPSPLSLIKRSKQCIRWGLFSDANKNKHDLLVSTASVYSLLHVNLVQRCGWLYQLLDSNGGHCTQKILPLAESRTVSVGFDRLSGLCDTAKNIFFL